MDSQTRFARASLRQRLRLLLSLHREDAGRCVPHPVEVSHEQCPDRLWAVQELARLDAELSQ